MPDRVLFFGIYLLCLINILQYAKQVSCAADKFLGWKAGDYPDPVLDPRSCGIPTKDISGIDTLTQGNNTSDNNLYFARICDPDQVLLPHECK